MMKSKATYMVLITALAMLIIAPSVFAGIVGSRHDFSPTGSSGLANLYFESSTMNQVDQVCIFCHTPHGASSDSASGTNQFLWNRVNSLATTSYKVYSSPSLTTAIVIDNPPKGITLMCMSCHDGVTTIQNILHGPGGQSLLALDSLSDQIGDVAIWTGAPVSYVTPFYDPNLGGLGPNGINSASGIADLSNDHPVSFSWVEIPGELHTAAEVKATSLKLFGPSNRVECSTCHSVHDDTIQPFLRMSNDNSAMCLTCHIK